MLAGYVLAQAMFVAVFGRIADVRGLRLVLLVGAALVGTGSLVAALSGSFATHLGGRLLQGSGGGAVWVAAFGTVAALTGTDRARALALISACLVVFSGAGSLIGGLTTDALSWRAVVALPLLCLLALGPSARLAPDTAQRQL